ncbi:hypothetical protein HHK36_000600 [Tetracentron sinense]|uniref:SAWADEE domain-containing protein n=1 Tax=Tetracentron sinense TaxID=13715 RepID=A0A834ZSH2_TETSI|nr:hypothetical protein HHK36_000600 [Tetracentron sinense]
MAPRNPNSGDTPAEIPISSLDFLSSDDAWYSVQLLLDNDTLTVKYCNFSDVFNERFKVGDFKSLEEVEDFKERFRPTSVQLQDHECSKVIEGMTVCASHVFGENDIRFYDAVIETVQFKEHSYVEGEEVCSCTFVVFWEHGPNAGNLTSIHIEHICLIQSGNAQIDPTLASFLKTSGEKLEVALRNSGLSSEGDVSVSRSGTWHSGTCGSTVPSNGPAFKLQSSMSESGRVNSQQERIRQDIDLGGKTFCMKNLEGTGNYHYLIIENLEKDLSPLKIVEFIYKKTTISPQAYVFPSLSSEPYTRAIIVSDSEEKLEKLYDFLDNPAYIIISSRGRPWVITEKVLKRGTFRATFGVLMPKSEVSFRVMISDKEF